MRLTFNDLVRGVQIVWRDMHSSHIPYYLVQADGLKVVGDQVKVASRYLSDHMREDISERPYHKCMLKIV